MFVYNIQFVNNIFSNGLDSVFCECCSFVRNLSFLLYNSIRHERVEKYDAFTDNIIRLN